MTCGTYKKQTNKEAPQWCDITVYYGASGDTDSSN